MTSLHAELSRGTIHVEIDRSSIPADEMFGFAERINPKRSFLFVSKVLGRHIPVRPETMQQTFDMLAAQIDPNLPGPVLCIGMAETAIGLGAGVHEAFVARADRPDVGFICTTRHDLGVEKLCEFSEDHSHATRHLIHLPVNPAMRELCLQARSLVLVDDEASTGNTFLNLFNSLPQPIRNQVSNIVLVTLTDWSDGAAEKALPGAVSVNISSGRYRWAPNPSNGAMPSVPQLPGDDRPEFTPILSDDWGRLGVTVHSNPLPLTSERELNGRIVVLGTGEFVWRPYQLARSLAADGHDVHYASLTRSPISVGHVICDKEMFPDNYGLGVANYCYNIGSNSFDTAVLCVETPLDYVSATLLNKLKSACNTVVLHSTVDGVAVLENEMEAA